MTININGFEAEISYTSMLEIAKNFDYCVSSERKGSGEPTVVSLACISAKKLTQEFDESILGLFSSEEQAQKACESFKENYIVWFVAHNDAAGYAYVDYAYTYDESWCSDSYCSLDMCDDKESAIEHCNAIIESWHCWLVAHCPTEDSYGIFEMTEGTFQQALPRYWNLVQKCSSLAEAEEVLSKFQASAAA